MTFNRLTFFIYIYCTVIVLTAENTISSDTLPANDYEDILTFSHSQSKTKYSPFLYYHHKPHYRGLGLAICQNTDIDSHVFKLVPSINEVVHYENDSYIVACQANGTRVRWLDPNNKWVDQHEKRHHVEERTLMTLNESSLVFNSISASDNGTWTCEAEKDNRKLTFTMIVYSKFNLAVVLLLAFNMMYIVFNIANVNINYTQCDLQTVVICFVCGLMIL